MTTSREAHLPRRGRAGTTSGLYSPAEVASALGCSEWWVKEQARRRRIPFTWIGGGYRFTLEHLGEIVRIFEVRPLTDGSSSATPSSKSRPSRIPTTKAAPALKAKPPRRARSDESSSAA